MFKIFFQENSENSSFLGISYDTIFTVLTTILIFILGYIVTKIIESNKERKRLKDLKGYFLKCIELLESPIEKQKQGFLKFSKYLKQDIEQHFVVDNIVNFNLSQVKEISNKDLFTIFVINKKGRISTKTELYGKLKASLDYFEAIRASFKKEVKTYTKKLDGYTSTYRKNIILLNDLLDEMITSNIRNQVLPEQMPLLYEINKVRIDWINSSENKNFQDMYVAFKNFVQPIQRLCQANQADQTITVIIKPLMKCVYSYHDIKELKYFYRRESLKDARNLQSKLFELKWVLNQFEKL